MHVEPNIFIVRSSRCGIKCHKQADILLVCCYECYRNMEASFALLYRAGRQLPVSECALLLPVPDISHILLLPFRFVCFRCFVRCFLYSCYIKYTDKPLIYDCTSFAVGMRGNEAPTRRQRQLKRPWTKFAPLYLIAIIPPRSICQTRSQANFEGFICTKPYANSTNLKIIAFLCLHPR